MKKRMLALLLAVSMILCLAACSGAENPEAPGQSQENDTPAGNSPETNPPAENPPAEKPSEEKPPEENPSEENPSEEKPAEENPSEQNPSEQNPSEAPTDLAGLVRAEYKNDKVVWMAQDHIYYTYDFIHLNAGWDCAAAGGVVLLYDYNSNTHYVYDPATGTRTELTDPDWFNRVNDRNIYMDGYYYCVIDGIVRRGGPNTATTSCAPFGGAGCYMIYCGGAFACIDSQTGATELYSPELSLLASAPAPQLEDGSAVEPKLGNCVAVDGVLYLGAVAGSEAYLFTMDTTVSSPTWKEMGLLKEQSPVLQNIAVKMMDNLMGRYYIYPFNYPEQNVYDAFTGERVGQLNGGYSPSEKAHYFDTEKYIGYDERTGEYRWVYLSDFSMSDPIQIPENYGFRFLSGNLLLYVGLYGLYIRDLTTGQDQTVLSFG